MRFRILSLRKPLVISWSFSVFTNVSRESPGHPQTEAQRPKASVCFTAAAVGGTVESAVCRPPQAAQAVTLEPSDGGRGQGAGLRLLGVDEGDPGGLRLAIEFERVEGCRHPLADLDAVPVFGRHAHAL